MNCVFKGCRYALGVALALIALLLKLTLRIRLHHDPRMDNTTEGRSNYSGYIAVTLHAHLLSAALSQGDRQVVGLLSRSKDGDVALPLLRALGARVARGSSRKGAVDKGGKVALQQLVEMVMGGRSAWITVDGPRGPRGVVKVGAALLASQSKTRLLPVLFIPRNRWVVTKSWDRFQIPKPFSIVDGYFGTPIEQEGKDIKYLCTQIETTLIDLEKTHDLEEFQRATVHSKPLFSASN